MAVPECINIPSLPAPKDITFPGGATLGQVLAAGSQIPDPLDSVTNLLAQANAAMAPLVPVFNIIDTVIALFNCVKAIPDSLGPPPDPTKLAECIPDLAKKVDELLKLIPQLSLPLLIVGIIDCLIEFLKGIKQQLEALIERLIEIANAATRAAELGDTQLQLVVDCAEDNINIQLEAMQQSFAPINKLIAVLNIFLGLLGLPEVPELGSLIESGNPEAALQPLDDTVKLLTDLRNAVPVP